MSLNPKSHRLGRSQEVQPGTQLHLTENRVEQEVGVTESQEGARILGVERGLPKGVSFYVELFDFQIQRRPRNSEFGCGSIWSSNYSVAFGKSRFDEFLLIALEGLREKT